MITFAVLLICLAVAGAVLYLLVVLPAGHVSRERERIAQETRLAQWQTSLIARRAMQALLEEARRGQR